MSYEILKCQCCGGNLKIMPMDSSGHQVMCCPYCKTTYLADMVSWVSPSTEVSRSKLPEKKYQANRSLDISDFDTSNIINMEGIFRYCDGLSSLDLSSFDTSNVTNKRLSLPDL